MKAYFWWKNMEAKNTATSFKRKEKKNIKSEFEIPQKCLSKTQAK